MKLEHPLFVLLISHTQISYNIFIYKFCYEITIISNVIIKGLTFFRSHTNTFLRSDSDVIHADINLNFNTKDEICEELTDKLCENRKKQKNTKEI